MRVSDTPLFTGAEMPSAGYVMVTLPINATEFRVHRMPKTLLGQTGPTGPAGPAGPQGLPGSSTFPAQSANMVFSGPAAGAAAVPAFRSLVAADIPSLSAIYLPLNAGALTADVVGLSFGGNNELLFSGNGIWPAPWGTSPGSRLLGKSGNPWAVVYAFQYDFEDQTSAQVWKWYGVNGTASLYNGLTADVLTVTSAGDMSVLGAGVFGGAVTLPGAPTLPLHAVTKAYVDASITGSVVQNRFEITGLTGGGATNLDGIPTAGIAAGQRVVLNVGGVPYRYVTRGGTLAEASPLYIRPDDYSAGTNEQYWELEGVFVFDQTTGSIWNLYATAGSIHLFVNGGNRFSVSTLGNASVAGTLAVASSASVVSTLTALKLLAVNTAATNWDTLTLETTANAAPGIKFLSGITNAAGRNWGFGLNHDFVGDLVIKESNAKNGDPMTAGTVRMGFNSGGVVRIPGSLTVTGAITMLQAVLGQAALTYAATVNLDFNAAAYQTLSLTGDVTFTTSNLAAGKSVTVEILCDATPRLFTFPATWKFMGTAPTGIAASKTAMMTVKASSTTDASCKVAYVVEA